MIVRLKHKTKAFTWVELYSFKMGDYASLFRLFIAMDLRQCTAS